MIVGITGMLIDETGNRLASEGAGKTTVADMMVKQGFASIGFADPVKRIARELFEFTDEQLWGPSEARNAPDPRYGGLTPRHVLQQLGTEVGRCIYEPVWSEYGLRTANRIMSGWGYSPLYGPIMAGAGLKVRGVVVHDVRFPNEVDAIFKAGGYVVRVIRPVARDSVKPSAHSSAVSLLGLPNSLFAIVHNNGGLRELQIEVDHLIEWLYDQEEEKQKRQTSTETATG